MPGNELVPTTLTEIAQDVELGIVRASNPKELVARATEAADALASVIESRKLYSNIQGKKFVRCEGWTTLAAMLGATPHEVSVTEQDGAFTATVELRRLTDGQAIGRASAECGSADEVDRAGKPLWASRPRNARRSMALTRATAKACRLAFSWIMALSGYEVTPAEEMHDDEKVAMGAQSGAGAKDAVPGPLAAAVRAQMPPQPEPSNGVPKWKGKPLTEFKSDELVRLKNWCLKANPSKFAGEVQAMDEILAGRAGE